MIDNVLRAIAEPRHREILHLIQVRELPAGEIATHFEVTRSAISQHLKVLIDAGLVTVHTEKQIARQADMNLELKRLRTDRDAARAPDCEPRRQHEEDHYQRPRDPIGGCRGRKPLIPEEAVS